ncbi:MAG: class I SAM-dependent methyltransferase, partial [Pyrinomonadaceae bacterium]
VSATSLEEARHRLRLHGAIADFILIVERDDKLPLDDSSVDLIHCSGVLHHTPDPLRILCEFRRVLKQNGNAQIMVYNYDSVFLHLYVGYTKMILEREFSGKSVQEAFSKLTDGPDCPISRCYRPDEFKAMAKEAGFNAEFLGCAVSTSEMQMLPRRYEALLDRRLRGESRRFLANLTFDERGCPVYNGYSAGVDGCYRLIAT